VKQWLRRAAALHANLSEVAQLRDPRWWLVAAGAALPWRDRMKSDAEPASDTFIGIPRPAPADPLALARAARTAIRELDSQLDGQPLAMTVARTDDRAAIVPSNLSLAALARGDRLTCIDLDAPDRELSHEDCVRAGRMPFVCITLGDEPLATARHGHRRAWRDGKGPWLGLGYSDGMTIVSTCHVAVDGYGHARLAARIAELVTGARTAEVAPPPVAIPYAIPLSIAWRPLETRPHALELAFAMGCCLHRLAGDPDARFSPTIRIPLAPDTRRRTFAITSVRFDRGEPEPYEVFAARTKAILANESRGPGASAQLMVAARRLTWKRQAIAASRPGWLDSLANLIGGRACISRIELDTPMPVACAVSSPARLATDEDPLGSCVVTVLDDGTRAAITLCGSGTCGAPARLDELLEALEPVAVANEASP